MSNRTPTPEIDRIWSQVEQLNRWHRLWIEHLDAQTGLNPRHPAGPDGDLRAYRAAAALYPDQYGKLPNWNDQVDWAEQKTRHDLVAALQVFNSKAGANTAHLGLTSHDIVDVATQIAIVQSLEQVIEQASVLARDLADAAGMWDDQLVVARTHGRPAQLTSYGHRIATIVSPLLDWIDRARDGLDGYPMRPPYGAVGTGADLLRVLTGWRGDSKASSRASGATSKPLEYLGWALTGTEPPKPSEAPSSGREPTPVEAEAFLSTYMAQLAGRLGFADTMEATRQTYHRSYDLHIAGLLAQLASIAQTWANDRRLEALLGLGAETRSEGQVGSSAMAHKTNPILCERIVSLAAVTRGYLSTAAELAGGEWLEGDVSGSAARRQWLPGIFQNTAAILVNWSDAHSRWEINRGAMEAEIRSNKIDLSTGAVLQFLVERGHSRDEAHRMVRQAHDEAGVGPASFFRECLAKLAGGGQSTKDQLRDVMDRAVSLPVGNMVAQIQRLRDRAAKDRS